MIQGIFYARFFAQKGTQIVAQSPPGCIVPAPGVDRAPLLDFNVLQEYIVPRKAFYGRLVAVDDPEGKYTVLGLPVCIASARYVRNEFIFNFGLVVEEADGVDRVPYERVVRRLAETFAEMEKQNSYLTQEDKRHEDMHDRTRSPAGEDTFADQRRPIESLLEIIKEDLNNYGECMIPVDDANTINMKLFPYHPNPPEVKGWHVPVAKMKFADVVDPTWDLTLQKVIGHIDGVSDVRRIAYLADVSLSLAQLALRHLLYYDTILLLDMFFFGACYAPRPGVHDFVANVGGIVDECANYVSIDGPDLDDWRTTASRSAGGTRPGTASGAGRSGGGGSSWVAAGSSSNNTSNNKTGVESRKESAPRQRVSNYMLIKLMTTFCVGKTVMEWLKGHMDNGFDVLRYVDVRRFVQFGVIKGCLYRVHKQVVSKQYIAALATGQTRPIALASGGDPLQKYTDGCHCFDQIITEQDLTDPEIMDKLKSFPAPAGDLTVIYK